MKKLLSTLALVLAISSVSLANTSNKKNISHKKMAVKTTYFCDDKGHIVGAIGSNGTVFGDICGCVC